MRGLPPLLRRLLGAPSRIPPGGRAGDAAPRPRRFETDRLGALLARRVRLPVSLRVTAAGEIEASVPALPECRVRAASCEAALGRLRATVVARLVSGTPAPDDGALARARPADAVPAPDCAWTEIVVVFDAGPPDGGA